MSSGHAFHVHGPHDHELEHAAHGGDAFAGRIAVLTAIFATIGAFFGYMAGATQNDALMYKNDSAIRRTEASDQWNFYQAKSSKQNLAELGGVLASGTEATRYKAEVERYNKEKQEIMTKAQELEKKSTELEEKSEAAMHVHHRWAQAMTLIQISIALAAITLLTRNRGLQYVSYGVAGVSIVLGALAFMHV
jgi:Na+/glutamate symporter